MTDTELFNEIVNRFAEQYPNAQIALKRYYDRNLVYAHGQAQFCIDGFNLLYNIQRLTNVLRDELQ